MNKKSTKIFINKQIKSKNIGILCLIIASKVRHKHTKPPLAPPNCCHQYNIFTLYFLITYEDHTLDFFLKSIFY